MIKWLLEQPRIGINQLFHHRRIYYKSSSVLSLSLFCSILSTKFSLSESSYSVSESDSSAEPNSLLSSSSVYNKQVLCYRYWDLSVYFENGVMQLIIPDDSLFSHGNCTDIGSLLKSCVLSNICYISVPDLLYINSITVLFFYTTYVQDLCTLDTKMVKRVIALTISYHSYFLDHLFFLW